MNIGSGKSKRHRLYELGVLNETMEIPKLSFTKYADVNLSDDLVRNLIDAAYFPLDSNHSMASSSALSALTMNPENVTNLMESGSLGAIIEMLNDHNFESRKKGADKHIENLIQSLCVVIADSSSQRRLLTNPKGPFCIFRLLINTSGKLQAEVFDVLVKLYFLEEFNSLPILVENNLLETLLTSHMLSKTTTFEPIRKFSASIINQVVSVYPDRFSIQKFDTIAFSFDAKNNTSDVYPTEKSSNVGYRVISGYIEVQLLNAMLNHLIWHHNNNANNLNFLNDSSAGEPRKLSTVGLHPYRYTSTNTSPNKSYLIYNRNNLHLYKYLIQEVLREEFEDLEHLILILKIFTFVTKDSKQIPYLIKNDITIMLQFVIRTDFDIWKKPSLSSNPMKNAIDASSSITSRALLGESFESRFASASFHRSMSSYSATRPSTTASSASSPSRTRKPRKSIFGNHSRSQNSISLLLNSSSSSREVLNNSKRFEDINYTLTKLSLNIYENIVNVNIHTIPDIVSSGIVPSLLFRVGHGEYKDNRFCPLVIGFLYLLLEKLHAHNNPNVSDAIPRRKLSTHSKKAMTVSTASITVDLGTSHPRHRRQPSQHSPRPSTADSGESMAESVPDDTSTMAPLSSPKIITTGTLNTVAGMTNPTTAMIRHNSGQSSDGSPRPLSSHRKASAMGAGSGRDHHRLGSSKGELDVSRIHMTDYLRHGSKASKQGKKPRDGKFALGLDIRSVTNILDAHGCTDLLTQGLHEDVVPAIEIRIKALRCLSFMHFRVIRNKLCTYSALERLCRIAINHAECFFVAVHLLVEVVNTLDERGDLLDILVVQVECLDIFVKSLRFAAFWGGPMRELMFECLAKLCTHERFYDRITHLDGVGLLVHEIHRRRKTRKLDRRTNGGGRSHQGEEGGEEEDKEPDEFFTERLLVDFRRDWAASRIQALIRARRARRLVGRKLFVLGYQVEGFADLQGQDISYSVAALFDKNNKKANNS